MQGDAISCGCGLGSNVLARNSFMQVADGVDEGSGSDVLAGSLFVQAGVASLAVGMAGHSFIGMKQR